MRGLYWLRSDLRIHDNLTLNQFCKECRHGTVLWTPTASYQRAGPNRRAFIDDCLFHHAKTLSKKGLHILRAEETAEKTMAQQLTDLKIEKVFFSRSSADEEVQEEKQIQSLCRSLGIATLNVDQETLVNAADLPFTQEDLPATFTAFRKKLEAHLTIHPPLPEPTAWPEPIGPWVQIHEPSNNHSLLFSGGETRALNRVQEYFWDTQAVSTYKLTRNGLLNWNDSTKLSPWFSQGALSVRKVYAELKKYEAEVGANESTYWVFFELLWRDYFKFLSRLYKNRFFLLSGIKNKTENRLTPDQAKFATWKNGQTNDTFINANMSELNRTGWMSNRGRQNVASFLIHNLSLPWTWGASYFEKALIDYDPDVNWGNWLYLSGNGTDPRDRVFNTERQAELYDPKFTYRKKWT